MSIKDERGVALVLALAVIALLCSLMVDFSYTMMVDLSLAANLRDEPQAFYAARPCVEVAKHLLQTDLVASDRDQFRILFHDNGDTVQTERVLIQCNHFIQQLVEVQRDIHGIPFFHDASNLAYDLACALGIRGNIVQDLLELLSFLVRM